MNAAPREGEGMETLNRSGVIVRPKQPFLDWLHTADPTSHELTLLDLVQDPTIYLIPECDASEELAAVLSVFCKEIFEEQLSGWYLDTSTWPANRSFDVFCQWFDFQHHSILVDLCDEPLIYD